MTDEKKFGARFFIREEELQYARDHASMMVTDEVSHMISRAVQELVYKAVENNGLNDMIVTVKKQELDVPNFLAEGWVFELRGERK